MDITINLRQVVPLALLEFSEDKEIRGRTRLMKYAFLTEELLQDDVDYEKTFDLDFYAYDYGPFSKRLLNDIEHLVDQEIIDVSEKRTYGGKRYDYKLTESGESLVHVLRDGFEQQVSPILEAASEVMRDFGSMGTGPLLDYVYEEYPEFQENSAYY